MIAPPLTASGAAATLRGSPPSRTALRGARAPSLRRGGSIDRPAHRSDHAPSVFAASSRVPGPLLGRGGPSDEHVEETSKNLLASSGLTRAQGSATPQARGFPASNPQRRPEFGRRWPRCRCSRRCERRIPERLLKPLVTMCHSGRAKMTKLRSSPRRLSAAACAFVLLVCIEIIALSALREWSSRSADLRSAEVETSNLAKSLA